MGLHTENGGFEAYVLLRSIECTPTAEEIHDITKVSLKLTELQEQMEELGIVCQCPAGSAVTKTLRKDNLKLDVILNYNNASISQGGGSQE